MILAPAMLLAASAVSASVDRYVERYFDTYPSKATEAGRSDFDDRLEDLSPARLLAWVAAGRETEGLPAGGVARLPSPDERSTPLRCSITSRASGTTSR